MRHVPVLANEVIDSLHLSPGMNVIDGTLGDAGHAEKILEKIGPDGKLLGIDADVEAVLRAKQYLYNFGERVIFVRDNFVNLKKIVAEQKLFPVNGVLLDLGWSSPQFEERERGFSFAKLEEKLDMRYGVGSGQLTVDSVTASDLVNELGEDELGKIFREYGEEKLSREIAVAIVETRLRQGCGGQRIETVGDLVNIILEVYRTKLKIPRLRSGQADERIPWVGGLHPATKVFQALRIAVNDELGVIEKVLPQAIEVLASSGSAGSPQGGRLAVITFHSLEDRIVKHYFQKQNNKTIKIITKKPIVCSEDESRLNPRASSAKLRVVEKI